MNINIQTEPKGRSPKGKFYFGDNAVKIDHIRTKDCQVGKIEDYKEFSDIMIKGRYDHKLLFATVGERFLVKTTSPEHAQFVRNMFNVEHQMQLQEYQFAWKIYHNMEIESEPRIWINLDKKEVLIAGTTFFGEIKKTVFTIMGYALPHNDILPMHCSAFLYDENLKAGIDSALMFGLSGTGKTTLSADPQYYLIGDDEIAWSNAGIHPIESGCYAKTDQLDRKTQPIIFDAMDFAKNKGVLIEENNGHANSRSSYPLDCVPGAITDQFKFHHPDSIFFLAMDAEGTLPAISKVEGETIRVLFETGYTSKMPGTEDGVNQIQRVFSPCYGSPFMPLPVKTYSDLLLKKIESNNTNVFLVNTGMNSKGKRFKLEYTRNCIKRALNDDYETSDVTWEGIPEKPIQLKKFK